MNWKCLNTCYCRENDIKLPYSEAIFCRRPLWKKFELGGIVSFEDNTKIGICKYHYKKFEDSEDLYHFYHGIIFDENRDKILNWEKTILRSDNRSIKCYAKTKLGIQCKKNCNSCYIHKDTKEKLFLCTIHQNKLVNDDNIEHVNNK